MNLRLTRKPRLAVIPSDSLDVYTEKGIGSWLQSYFNPAGFFGEVFCLSPLETARRNIYGLQVIPTPPELFAARLQDLQIDIVRAYGAYWACDLACANRLARVPVVVSVHDTHPGLLHDSVLQADYVLAVSKAVKEVLLRHGVEPQRIYDFANRVNLDIFKPITEKRLRASFEDRYPGRYRILHVGRKTEQKNADTLIRALQMLGPEYIGIFVGPGDETPYLRLAEQLQIKDRCYFVGAIPNPDLAQYYSFCDCMCTPSRWEGFGIVFVEALACEAVIVTSNIAPMNEYIESGKNGLLVDDFQNPHAIAEAIQAACTNIELRDSLRRQARAAAEPYRKERIEQLEVSLYTRFLKENQVNPLVESHTMLPSIDPRWEWVQEKLRTSKRIIDLGCGNNPVPGATVAVDNYLEPEQRQLGHGQVIAPANFEARGIQFVNQRIDVRLPFADKEFDFAYSHHVFEHLDDPATACREMMRIAKSGAIITPSIFAEHVFGRLYHKWLMIDGTSTLYFFEKRAAEDRPFGDHPNPFDIVLNLGDWHSGDVDPILEEIREKFRNYWHSHSSVMETVFIWNDAFKFEVVEHRGYESQSFTTGFELPVKTAVDEQREYYLARLPIFRLLVEENISDPVVRKSPEFMAKLQTAGMENPDLTNYWKRVTFIAQHSRGRVLELGSGCGNITRYIAANPSVTQIVAVDEILEYIEVLRSLSLRNVSALCGDMLTVEIAGKFDCVVLAEVIEHLTPEEETTLLNRLRYLLKQGATFVVTTPIGFMPNPDHIRGFSPEEFKEHLIQDYGELIVTADNGIQQFAVVLSRPQPVQEAKIDSQAIESTSENALLEQSKWDQYYASLTPGEEWESLKEFNKEFIDAILRTLPEGGRALEAGCGGGWQSLALARTGKFRVDLMDFSEKALDYARQLFQQNGLKANFLLKDVRQPGTPDYDLVFNAGVLEHYTFDEQVEFLKGMASRSRKYVLTLVPNRECYWYWLWRVQAAAQDNWPYGKEVPVTEQSAVFEAAGLHVVSKTYMGESWAEEFITNLVGISDELRQQILSIHRAALISSSQRAYLIATLACVNEADAQALSRPQSQPFAATNPPSEVYAALADALALQLSLRHLQYENHRLSEFIGSQQNRIDEYTSQLYSLLVEIAVKNNAIWDAQHQVEQYQQLQQTLTVQLTDGDQRIQMLAVQLGDLVDQLEQQAKRFNAASLELSTLKNSDGYHLLLILWRARYWLIPKASCRESILQRLWMAVRGRPQQIGQTQELVTRASYSNRPISWYAYAFHTYQRARHRLAPPDLSPVRCPSETGLVSIVVPAYNGADMLPEALDSILRQSYQKFEIIAINDGSQDDTGNILDEYARRDSRVRVFHQENHKLPRTLSRGFRLARGQYLTWTSCDNRLAPDFLERMVGCLEQHPQWDFVYANIDIIDDAGAPLHESDWYSLYQRPPGSHHVYLPQDPAELNTYANNYVGAAFLYRDRVAWLIGDYSPFRFTTEDYDYWMRVNELLTLRHVDSQSPLYEYRFHDKSLTSRDQELGITRNRVRLMVFDDFRRDFALTPLVWIIESDPRAETQALAGQLAELVRQAGHTLSDLKHLNSAETPSLWMPLVYVRVTTDAVNVTPPTDQLPRQTFPAVLIPAGAKIPTPMPKGWELSVTLDSTVDLARLPETYSGWLGIPDLNTLLTAVDIRVREKQFSLIEAEIYQPKTRLRVSAIVCTYRRGELLEQAIISLANQTLTPEDYEVIVVNNDPNDRALMGTIDRLRSEYFDGSAQRLRAVVCPLLGLSHARNAGIGEANGEVLCFLDDDAIAPADWLEEMLRAFDEHPQAGVIGGHIRLKIPDPRPPDLKSGWEWYWSEFITGCSQYTEVDHWWEFPWGADWCTRRQALVEVGGFRTSYGRRGKDFGGGEEVVAAELIKRLGYTVAVLPQVEVIHAVDPERFTKKHVKNTIRASILASYTMQTNLHRPMEASIPNTLRRLGGISRDLFKAFWHYRPSIGSAKIEETFYRFGAYVTLLRWQIRDWRRRNLRGSFDSKPN
jgi:glycosyltransferase involved in cell wall biosynthesis/2-polyprenyl-3-methyl-5-hydroxy-6-metoxy-1,4-benzoquinol methylase